MPPSQATQHAGLADGWDQESAALRSLAKDRIGGLDSHLLMGWQDNIAPGLSPVLL